MRQAAENGTIPPTQPQARQDALLPERRSRFYQLLNVPLEKSRSGPAQGWAGEMVVRFRCALKPAALLDDRFEQPDANLESLFVNRVMK
jgi:hypothetical protein